MEREVNNWGEYIIVLVYNYKVAYKKKSKYKKIHISKYFYARIKSYSNMLLCPFAYVITALNSCPVLLKNGPKNSNFQPLFLSRYFIKLHKKTSSLFLDH